jgi:hypothetical protein
MARIPQSDAFRHTFLTRFTRGPHRATLRSVGNLLGMLTTEARHILPPPPKPQVAILQAAEWDLRHLQADLLRYRGTAPCGGPCRVLYLLAGDVAHQAAQLADRIETGLRETAP